MASVFDGMAGALNAVFGARVTWVPDGGQASALQAVFRETPVQVQTPDGGLVLVTDPTLSVQAQPAAAMAEGDTIAPGNGKAYRLGARHPSGSPATDAFVIFELELIP